MLTTRGESTACGMAWRDSIARSDPEEIPRPPDQQIYQQRHQGRDQPTADDEEPPVHVGHLFLSGDGALLELEGALGHAPILGQMLALGVANLLQELADLVTVHSAMSAPTPTARAALALRRVLARARAREHARRGQ